jgi:cell division protein FtsB
MRLLALVLAAILVGLQGPLWFGRGGFLRVRDLSQQLEQQKAATAKLEARTRAFEAEVRDLKTGTEALEERARSDLGMIKQDEIFFQLAPPASTPPASTPPETAARPPNPPR